MFDIAMEVLTQFVKLLPGIFAVWLIFDLVGGLLFKND